MPVPSKARSSNDSHTLVPRPKTMGPLTGTRLMAASLRTETRPSSCLCSGESSSRPYSDSSSRSDAAPPLPSLSISDR